MKYFLHLSFLGTNYHGWQRQENLISVQSVIEDNISKMLGWDKCIIYGCGRTDAGVHASQYFAHVDLPEALDFDPLERLNHMLPKDISIREIIKVNPRAHAQYDAQFRTYQYHIHTRKDALSFQTSSYYRLNHLNEEAMHEAMKFIEETKDFKSLCKVPDRHNHTESNMTHAILKFDREKHAILFTFRANRFLQRQIRIMVQKLLEIGQGNISIDYFKTIVSEKQLFPELNSAFAQGLFLTKVEYPEIVFKVD